VVVAGYPDLLEVRRVFSVLSIAAAWWHLRHLVRGMRDLCESTVALPAWREWTLGGLILTAGVLALLPLAPRTDAALQSYLLRIMLLAVAWSLSYAAAGLWILRRRTQASALARRTLGISLLAYGALRLLEPLAHFVGPSPILQPFITFGGLPLLVGVGAGMLISLLDVERERAVAEAEARTMAERTATASEALLATALASSSDPVLVVDGHGRLLTCNERFAEIARTGRMVEAVPGLPLEQVVGRDALPLWREMFSRAMSGEAQMRTEQFVLAPGEAPRSFAVRATPVRESGAIIGVLLVAQDATEEERLRQALARREEWFRSMIENASDIILQVTPDGRLQYASPSVTRLLGYDHESLIGGDAFSLVHPEDIVALRDAMGRAFARDDSVPATVAFRARHVSGEYVHLEAVSRPYPEADGSERLIVAARDVRERRRLESELLAARRLESVGRLAGGVAHDFNNLLTAVAGNVSLLRERDTEDPALVEHLNEIEHAVQRGSELTRRLLAFARRQVVEPRVLDVAVHIRDLERLLRRLLGDSIPLDVDPGEGLWAIRVDPTALEQILVNLAVNARDAMPAGGTLRLAVWNETIHAAPRDGFGVPPGAWVRLDVSDTGEGIEEAVLGQIFEPFFTTKDRTGGTGLGLATVYGAVTQAGGHIRVTSRVGEGTTFTVYFPRVPSESAATAEPATGPFPRAATGETVLLIEDEPAVRDVTIKLLRRLGYAVLPAEDGERGVDVARTHPGRLDLVISDLMMPGITGVEAVAQIRALRRDIKVVFISGFSEEALQWRDGMPSEGRLLSKPFSVEDLAKTLRATLDG